MEYRYIDQDQFYAQGSIRVYCDNRLAIYIAQKPFVS